jgi:hypothetical protein
VWVCVAETPGLCATSFRSRAAGSYCPDARQAYGTGTGNSVADCERLQVKGSLLCLEAPRQWVGYLRWFQSVAAGESRQLRHGRRYARRRWWW